MLDPLVTPQTPLAVQLERGSSSYRFEGKSVEVGWDIDPRGGSRLTAKALDRTLDMNLEEKVAAWRASDGGIAQTILKSHNVRPEITQTPDKADADVHVVMQRAGLGVPARARGEVGLRRLRRSRNGGPSRRLDPLDPDATPQAELVFGTGATAVARACRHSSSQVEA